jgi:hypothetical protein
MGYLYAKEIAINNCKIEIVKLKYAVEICLKI